MNVVADSDIITEQDGGCTANDYSIHLAMQRLYINLIYKVLTQAGCRGKLFFRA